MLETPWSQLCIMFAMDAQQLAEAIVQATAVTHDPTATAQRRAEAVQFFEQVQKYSKPM